MFQGRLFDLAVKREHGSYDDRIFNDFSCMCDKACCLYILQHKNGIFEIISKAAKSEKIKS